MCQDVGEYLEMLEKHNSKERKFRESKRVNRCKQNMEKKKNTWLVKLARVKKTQNHKQLLFSPCALSSKGSGLSNLQTVWQHVNTVWKNCAKGAAGWSKSCRGLCVYVCVCVCLCVRAGALVCFYAVQENPAVLTKLQQPSLLASVKQTNSSIKSNNTLKSQISPLTMKVLCDRNGL